MKPTIAIIALAFLVAGCGAPQAEPQMPPPPQVGVASPISRTLPLERVLSGRVEAIETVEVAPQVSGIVSAVHAADGAEVKAGDPILTVDPAPFQAALARAEAGVAQAEANLRLATDARDRNQRLVKDGVVPQQVYDDSVTAAVAAEAALAAARAALVTARLDLSYTVVKAPIAGRLGTVRSTVGNVVQGGGGFPPSIITDLVAMDPVEVSFDLDEPTWRRMAPRLAASASGGEAVPVRVGLAGEDALPHAGRIVFVDNRVAPGAGSVRVRARLPNPDRLLVPGAFARIAIAVEAPRPVLLVHEEAVQAQLATRYVLGVGADGVTAFRPVQLGATHGRLREVTGLVADDRIVVTNLAKIFFPGMPVQPQPVDMETLQPVDAPKPAEAAPPVAAPEAR